MKLAGGVDAIRFLNLYIFLTSRAPTAGSEGSTVDHLGLQVANLAATLGRLREAGYATVTNAAGVAAPAALHHVHFFTNHAGDMKAWYQNVFGERIPGLGLLFQSTPGPTAAPLVTKTLLLVTVSNVTPAGEPYTAPWSKWVNADGPHKLLYVLDKRDGRPLHVVSLEGATRASGGAPITYLHQGTQYIVVAAGAVEQSELIALALGGSPR